MKAMSVCGSMPCFCLFITLCLQKVDAVKIGHDQYGVGNGVISNQETPIEDNHIIRTRKSNDNVAIDAATKSNVSGCQFSVPQNMKDMFRDYVNNKKINLMFIKLKFMSTYHYNHKVDYKSDKYFFPRYLTWTYKGGPGAGLPILSYPYDFKIRSLGFLSWHVLDRLVINITVIPEDCNFTWGEPQTMVDLLATARTITSKHMEHNQTSYWCYGIKFKMSVVRRWLAHVTGMLTESTGYMCSTPDDPKTFSEAYHQTRMSYFLNVLGVVLFSFTPLFLFIFDNRRALPQYSTRTQKKKLSDAIKGRIYMLLHPKFWLYFLNVWRGRMRVCYRRLPFYGLMKTIVCVCLFIPALVIITILFLADILCCVAYYGIPIVFFTKTILHNSVEYMTDRLMKAPPRSGCKKFFECVLRFLFLFIIMYVLACTYTILATTIQIGTRTFMFVFYGILAFPNEAIMSIIFVLIGLIYVYKSLASFNEAYNDYLYMTITVSLEQEEGRLGETLTEANDYSNQSTAMSPYVVYKNGVPGIHEHLYVHIIERYRPVRIRVFLTLIYLAVVGGFMYISMSVIQSFNRQSELPIMVKLIATVGAGLLPRLFQMCWGSTNQKAEDDQFKYKLRESIVKYWERHHLYVPLIERA